MKKILLLLLILILSFTCPACGIIPEELVDDNPQELKFYKQDDGTYVVSCGDAIYRNEIVIPEKYKGGAVVAIGINGFANCTSLTSIIIPDSVTKIDNSAFSGCASLTSITIPDSITRIGDNAFSDCTSLTTLKFEGSWQQWNRISLGSNWYANTQVKKVECSNDTIYIDLNFK